MEVKLPSDCGNAPRIGIVGDFAVNWAKGNNEAVSECLADDAIWVLVGVDTHRGPGAAAKSGPPIEPVRLEVVSIITHGRLASCDGYLESEGERVAFSHVFRFASTSKTAKLAEVRSYYIRN